MTNSFRKVLLSGLGFAAASTAVLAGPSFAAPAPSAQPTVAGSQIAQTYIPLVGEVGTASEQGTGWYLTLGAGGAWPSDRDFQDNLKNFNFDGNIQHGGGFAVDGGVGYDFGAIRTELTYGYSRFNINQIDLNYKGGRETAFTSGSGNKNDVLASLYLDIPVSTHFVPYIGGGIGYTNIGTPGFSAATNDARINVGSSNRGAFGWQAKLGLAYVLNWNADVYAEGIYSGASGTTNNSDVNFSSFSNWGAKLGVRYRFGQAPVAVVEQPAPAPEPAPAPAPAPMPEPAPAPAPIRGLW
jgi:opacity protein-like surface antigen